MIAGWMNMVKPLISGKKNEIWHNCSPFLKEAETDLGQNNCHQKSMMSNIKRVNHQHKEIFQHFKMDIKIKLV